MGERSKRERREETERTRGGATNTRPERKNKLRIKWGVNTGVAHTRPEERGARKEQEIERQKERVTGEKRQTRARENKSKGERERQDKTERTRPENKQGLTRQGQEQEGERESEHQTADGQLWPNARLLELKEKREKLPYLIV